MTRLILQLERLVSQGYGFGAKEEEEKGKIPIKAYFLCTRLLKLGGILVIAVKWLSSSTDQLSFSTSKITRYKPRNGLNWNIRDRSKKASSTCGEGEFTSS